MRRTAPLGLDGATARGRCAAARITLDKCPMPGDPAPERTVSGVRLGAAAVTSQGMGEAEMKRIAVLVGRALRSDPGTAADVAALAAAFPPYPSAPNGRKSTL